MFFARFSAAAAACIFALLIASPSISHAAVIPIHQIQGGGFLSPLNNTVATTEGIVTAVVADGYFIQTPLASYDANPATSQGLFVFIGTAPAANIVSGALVQVTGTVEEYRPASNPHQLTFTRLKNISLTTVVSTGNSLPSANTLTDTDLNDGNSIDWMERYEGMRVRVNELKVTQPVGGLLNEATGEATLDGVFYGVLPNITRPTREPGIGITDSFVIPAGKSIPFFDTNPENLRVDSSRLTGLAALSPDYQDVVNNLTGVLDYKEGTPTLLAFPNASTNVTLNSRTFSLGSGTRHEDISFSTYNLDRLFDDVNDPSIPEPVLNTQTFENRLYKLANSICYHIGTPQVIAVYEVENLSTLQRLADSIYNNRYACYESPRYTAYLLESNDPSGLDSGLLVLDPPISGNKARLQLLSVEQIAGSATFQNPSTSLEPLFYRASLIAKIRVTHRNGNSVDLSVVISDFISNKDINSSVAGSNGWASIGLYVRKKRAAQALSLAQYIENRQLADPSEKIILLGNFNADKFSDGYVDVMGIVTGREAAEANVIEYENSPITTPMTNLSTRSEPVTESMNAAEDQNTSVANGNMQRLEHIVLNQNAMSYFSTLWGVPRANAAFGIDLMNDTSVLVRASRYEPTVAALTNDSFRSIDLQAAGIPIPNRPVEGTTNEYLVNGQITSNYKIYLISNGENSAKGMVFEVTSSLASNQWSLIYNSSANLLDCSPITVAGTGSKMTCTADDFGPNALYGADLDLEIPANASLENTTATFGLHITHNGGGIDYDLSNNAVTSILRFKSTTDLKVQNVYAPSPILAGDAAAVIFTVKNVGVAEPGNVKFSITSNILPSEASIQPSDFGAGWACDSGVVQSGGKTKWTCDSSSWISTLEGKHFSLFTNPTLGNGGKTFDFLAEASSSVPDENVGDNSALASVRVLDDAELSATASLLSENTIRLNQFAYFGFNVTNTYPSIARNAKVELIFDALPQDVSPISANSYFYNDSFRPPVWVCGDAQLYNSTQSRVICSGALQHVQTPSGNFTSWLFQAKVVPRPVVNQQTSIINATVRFYSDSIDTNLSNNTSTATQTVNQTTDLSLARISVNGVGNPGQVAEPGSIVFSISPSYDVFNQAINAPINTRINFELNEVIASSKIQVFKGSTNRILMSCTISPNVPTGRTRIVCPDTLVALSDYVTVIIKTDDTMHGKAITLTATGTNDLYDINLTNNTISISTVVIAQSDLCISPNDSSSDANSCGSATVLLAGRIVAGDKEGFLLNYRNLGPSMAKNMKAKIRAGIASSRLTARMNEQTFCGGALAINANESEITCNLGNIAAGTVDKLEFWLDTIGEVNGRTLAYQVSLSSDAEEINGINSVFTSSVPVVPIVDLSSQVQTKGDGGTYLTSQDFYITAQAVGPATTSPSQIKITTSAPGARTYPQIIANGWSCSLTGGTVTSTQYACNRNSALPGNVVDRIVLRFQPNFMQVGESIAVTSEHVYQSNALAVDRNAVNNTGSASRRITGRRALDTTPPLVQPPIAKPKPLLPPINKSPLTAKKKSTVH